MQFAYSLEKHDGLHLRPQWGTHINPIPSTFERKVPFRRAWEEGKIGVGKREGRGLGRDHPQLTLKLGNSEMQSTNKQQVSQQIAKFKSKPMIWQSTNRKNSKFMFRNTRSTHSQCQYYTVHLQLYCINQYRVALNKRPQSQSDYVSDNVNKD